MDAEETIDYFQDELDLDKGSAIKRAIQQGKKPGRDERTPKDIKKKENFIDRLILKEKDIDEGDIAEDVLVDKEKNEDDNVGKKRLDINPLLVRNIKSIKKMAKENGITVKELIMMLKNEQ
jgi:hypothetical protein